VARQISEERCATMSANECSRFLGISRSQVYELARRDEIPHIRLGRRILFGRESITKLVRGQ
jgi:excisionase family DNA binding protein